MFIEGEAVDESLVSARSAGDQRDGAPPRPRAGTDSGAAAHGARGVRGGQRRTARGNEELQSINEEYRSTSEELETSKEELQSINEELQTVNSELKLKLEAVSRAHSDLQNLVAATDIGTLFLDSSLRINRFTDRIDRSVQHHPDRRGPADHRFRPSARI